MTTGDRLYDLDEADAEAAEARARASTRRAVTGGALSVLARAVAPTLPGGVGEFARALSTKTKADALSAVKATRDELDLPARQILNVLASSEFCRVPSSGLLSKAARYLARRGLVVIVSEEADPPRLTVRSAR